MGANPGISCNRQTGLATPSLRRKAPGMAMRNPIELANYIRNVVKEVKGVPSDYGPFFRNIRADIKAICSPAIKAEAERLLQKTSQCSNLWERVPDKYPAAMSNTLEELAVFFEKQKPNM
jgi:hypothetical protein